MFCEQGNKLLFERSFLVVSFLFLNISHHRSWLLNRGPAGLTSSFVRFSKVFDQYLRMTKIPLLKYNVKGKTLSFYYERVVKGFGMPIRVIINGREIQMTPNEVKQTLEFSEEIKTLEANRNFYIEAAKSDL